MKQRNDSGYDIEIGPDEQGRYVSLGFGETLDSETAYPYLTEVENDPKPKPTKTDDTPKPEGAQA